MYCPKHIKQQPGSSDCGPSSLGMAVDFATFGAVRPKAATIRDVINDNEGGTNPLQWLEFCRKMGIVAAKIQDSAGLRKTLNAGNGVVIAVDYNLWRKAGLPAYTTFTGWHAIMLHDVERDGRVHVHDPLTTVGVGVDAEAIIRFMGSQPNAIVVRGSRYLRVQDALPAQPTDEEKRLAALLDEARVEAEGVRVAAENTVELVDALQILLADV